MRTISIVILAMLLSGCGAGTLTVDRAPVDLVRYKPPRPAPIEPQKVKVEALTYAVTKNMNAKVESGESLPYQYMCSTHQDYLTAGQWHQDVLRYVRQVNQVLDFYEGREAKPLDK